MWVFWIEVKLFKYLINFTIETEEGIKLYKKISKTTIKIIIMRNAQVCD